jgi:hypothetical protein
MLCSHEQQYYNFAPKTINYMEFKNAQSNQAKKIITLVCIALLTLVILLMACGAFAQNTFYVGPYLGLGNQESYNSNFYNDPSVKITHVPGASFGVNVQDSMNSNMSLGFGLGYSGFGTQAQYNDVTAEEGTIMGTYYDSYGYISAPLSLMVKTKTTTMNSIGLYGQFQLIPSVNTSATQKQTLYGSSLTLDTASTTLANIKNETHTFNFMVGVSGGLIFNMNNMMIQIGPYYTTSLLDANKTPNSSYTTVSGTVESYKPTTMRSMGINVNVAIKINSHKTKASPIASTTATK